MIQIYPFVQHLSHGLYFGYKSTQKVNLNGKYGIPYGTNFKSGLNIEVPEVRHDSTYFRVVQDQKNGVSQRLERRKSKV